jgi:hypothetical protein
MPRDARELVRDSIDGDYVLDTLRPEGASACVLVWDGDGNVTVTPVEPMTHLAAFGSIMDVLIPAWREAGRA